MYVRCSVGQGDADLQTDLVATHSKVVSYDFYGAYDDPIESDAQQYLGMYVFLILSDPSDIHRQPHGHPGSSCA